MPLSQTFSQNRTIRLFGGYISGGMEPLKISENPFGEDSPTQEARPIARVQVGEI